MSVELSSIREAMTNKTDDELRLVVSVQRSDYQPAAIEIALDELRRRGIEPVTEDTAKEVQKRVEEKRMREMSSRWINIYSVVIGLCSFYVMLRLLLLFEEMSAVTIIGCIWLANVALTILVAAGLLKRKRWAWNLNWVCLVGVIIMQAWGFYPHYIGGIILGAIWCIPNAVYFKKRRHMFS